MNRDATVVHSHDECRSRPYAGEVLRRALLLATVALAAALPVPAHGHGTAVSASELKLRRFETATLGRAHAAEHARLRRYQRSPRRRRAVRRAGVAARAAAAGDLDQVGRWTAPFDIPVFAINAVTLPTGKVLWFAYPNSPDYADGRKNESDAYLWDPAKGTGDDAFERVTPPIDPATGKPVNLFCAGTSFTADGRVVVSGGNLKYPADPGGPAYAGLKHLYTFDPFTKTWTRQPDMSHGRWYPSQLLLPDGRTFIMGGLDEGGFGVKNEDLELFTPSAAMDGVGTVEFLGPEGVLSKSGDPLVPPVGDYYPHLFWMPSGHGLVAGPWTIDTWRFEPPGAPPQLSFEDRANTAFSRVWGTAVLMPGGTGGSPEVMQIGGSDKPTADGAGTDPVATDSVSVYDERDDDAGWQDSDAIATGSLNVARSHANTVLLPDGTMATIGGGLGSVQTGSPNGSPGQYAAEEPQLQTELWDPATRTWALGAAQQEYRAYHSTAVLLPDGRIVSAGDDYNGRFTVDPTMNQRQDSAEIYEPPYLFDGTALAPRPRITSSATAMKWAKAYELGVAGADGTTRAVTRAALVAPGAATHAVDMNQRYVPLEVTARTSGSLTVKTPADGNIAPGGWYMLFVLDETGTPSMARWVRLDAAAPDPVVTPTPTPSATSTATPTPTASPTATPGPSPAATPAPTTVPPAVEPAVRAPTAKARIVRRHGKRRIRVTVGRSVRLTVRATLLLRDRRGHTRRRVVVTVRTGRSTVLTKLRVGRAVRAVRVRIR